MARASMNEPKRRRAQSAPAQVIQPEEQALAAPLDQAQSLGHQLAETPYADPYGPLPSGLQNSYDIGYGEASKPSVLPRSSSWQPPPVPPRSSSTQSTASTSASTTTSSSPQSDSFADEYSDLHGTASHGTDIATNIMNVSGDTANAISGSFGATFGLGGGIMSAVSQAQNLKQNWDQDRFNTGMNVASTATDTAKNIGQLALSFGAEGAASVVPGLGIAKDSIDTVRSGVNTVNQARHRSKLDELATQYGGAISDEDQRSAFLSGLDQQKKTGKKMQVGRSRSPMARGQLEGLTAEQRKAHAAEFLAYQSHKNRNRNALNTTSSVLMTAGGVTALTGGGAIAGGAMMIGGASLKGGGALRRGMLKRIQKEHASAKESERLYWAGQFHKSHQAQKAGGEASPYAEALEAFGISTENMDDMTAEDLYKKLLTQ